MDRTRATMAITTLAATAVAVTALLNPAARPASAQAPAPGGQTLDLGQLQSLYSVKCSACHNLYDPSTMNFTRADWQRTVTKMLVQYKASDEISPTEASEIVDYLATFAPKSGNGGKPSNPWDTDDIDVWTTAPSLTRVLNFQAAEPLGTLKQMSSGTPGPAGVWRAVTYDPGPDGLGVKVSELKPSPTRFALLVDPADTAKNIDIRVRFEILAGHVSPSVGIVYGLTDAQDYSVLRYDATHNTLSALQIAGVAHTPLQVTAIDQPDAALPPADGTGPALPAADTAPVAPPALSPDMPTPGWHTLRLLVNDGQIRGWIDRTKRVSINDPSYAGGDVGLWTQGDTVAIFDDWMIDIYDAPPTSDVPATPGA